MNSIFIKLMFTFDAIAFILLIVAMIKEEINILKYAMISIGIAFACGAISFWFLPF